MARLGSCRPLTSGTEVKIEHKVSTVTGWHQGGQQLAGRKAPERGRERGVGEKTKTKTKRVQVRIR